MKIKAHSKVNLTLDIVGKKENGYHLLKTIMQSLELADVVDVELAEKDIQVKTSLKYLPDDKNNIAYKAADAFFKYFNLNCGAKIYIEKNIPVAAGMAGGSTDGAAVIKALNQLTGINADVETLIKIGETVGADIPFCIVGGTVLCEGIGEILTPLKSLKPCPVLIAKPDFPISTVEIFKKVKLGDMKHHPDTEGAMKAIEKGNLYDLSKRMYNVLEEITASEKPVIKEIESVMLDNNAMCSLMTGSGPTVFGLFESVDDAKKAEQALKQFNIFTCVTSIK